MTQARGPFGVLAALALSVLICAAFAAAAQIPALPGLTGGAPSKGSPAVVNWASAPVEVNDTVLFRRYAEDAETARLRADVASLRLQRIADGIKSRPLPVVEVNPDGVPPVDIVVDRQTILTITSADTQATGVDAPRLGEMWANEIRRAFAAAYAERQPDYLRDALLQAGLWLLAGVALYAALLRLRRRWLDRTSWPAFALLWALVAGRILVLFPQTRPLYNLLVHGAVRPLTVAIVTVLAAVAFARAWSSVLHNVFTVPEELSLAERTERAFRRRLTLIGVTRITGVTIIWIIAFFTALSWAGVNWSALIASAGLIGVGIGLAAQDSMKDIVAGVNILIDDRYGVGDVIGLQGYSGRVERLNLRITQIRDMSGQLITVPNRTVDTVVNMTSRWSQVDLQMGVGYSTDLRKAMEAMEEAARSLRKDWPQRVLGDPEMLGVDRFDDSSITLRMLLRTAPGDQWAVGRELNLRVKDAFDAAGIEIPFPQRDVWLRGNGKTE